LECFLCSELLWDLSIHFLVPLIILHFYHSQADSAPPEIPIITRKDSPFLNLEKERAKEGDEEDMKEVEGKIVVPNPHKDDLARRRTEGRPRPPKDPHQSLVQTSITQSDLETWQRLKMNTESRCLEINTHTFSYIFLLFIH